MKKLLITALFFVFITGAAQETPISLVNVTGKGTVKVVPDEVLINARIEHTGKSPKEVKAQNDKVVNEIIKYLKSQDIPSKNFQTEYIRLSKDYNYNSKETFYSANQAISIKLEDLSKYEKIMSGLLESGLNRIDGIMFQSSQKEELESQARKNAVLDAQKKAKELANALGQDIGKAQSISEAGGGNYPQPMYKAAMMDVAQEESEETIAPGEMEITIRVNAAFVLE
ncbi:SIMPL domain-containing protein [Salinimicrobium gaetbulicola]|uniref:SIMPL domain-containing protein n=1 Tax=Salinimicrobium gaetbulicola TaxID=999702 RepID=A0ABW3IE13_9FLAO